MLTVIVNKSCATGLSSARPSSWAQSPSISQPLSWQALVIRPIVNKITGPYCIWRYCLLPCKFISWWAAKREEDEEENKEVKKKTRKEREVGGKRVECTRRVNPTSVVLFNLAVFDIESTRLCCAKQLSFSIPYISRSSYYFVLVIVGCQCADHVWSAPHSSVFSSIDPFNCKHQKGYALTFVRANCIRQRDGKLDSKRRRA